MHTWRSLDRQRGPVTLSCGAAWMTGSPWCSIDRLAASRSADRKAQCIVRQSCASVGEAVHRSAKLCIGRRSCASLAELCIVRRSCASLGRAAHRSAKLCIVSGAVHRSANLGRSGGDPVASWRPGGQSLDRFQAESGGRSTSSQATARSRSGHGPSLLLMGGRTGLRHTNGQVIDH